MKKFIKIIFFIIIIQKLTLGKQQDISDHEFSKDNISK